VSRRVVSNLALHLGLQGEFYYPFPLPGYGLYAGVSYEWRVGNLAIAPALSARGATDFGFSTLSSMWSSILGGEATLSVVYYSEEKVTLGVVPFFGLHQVDSTRDGLALYPGVAFTARAGDFEFSAGAGYAIIPNLASWPAPIFGVRGGS
jgi:hypothetical protein